MNKYRKQEWIRRGISSVILVILILILRKPIISIFNYTKIGVNYIEYKLVDFKSYVYGSIVDFKRKSYLVSNINTTIEDVEKLKRQLEIQKIDLEDYEKLKEENIKLRETLELSQSIKYKKIVAEVKLIEDVSREDNIYISKGTSEGVQLGNVVMYNGFMIGLVNKVFDNYSEVRLLTSKESKLSIILNNKHIAVLRGNGNGTYSVKNFNVDINTEDDLKFNIKTSGISDIVPKNISIGNYEIKDEKYLKETKELIFKPEYNLVNINFVIVLTEDKK